MEAKWVLTEPPDSELLKRLKQELNVPTLIAKVLINRGIRSFEMAREFLKPSLDDLYDPFQMAHMDRAVERLARAIQRGESIMIHGDYDVDGVTGTSFLYRILKFLGSEVSFYIPNRVEEGYGISALGVEEGKRRNVGLIISVDCGITAIEEVSLANRLGIDVIVTDHHEPGDGLPEAVAVIDPKRRDCPYPFKELSGVALAFKLACALFEQLGIDPKPVYDNLDLVALGCAADIVPMIDENRVLVKYGLERMRVTGNLGLRALIDNVGLRGKSLGTGQLVFILAPRINAVGRLGSAERAVELLITEDQMQAMAVSQVLEEENRRRRDLDDRTFSEAMDMVRECVGAGDSSVVLASEGWHPGVIGIVASRVAEAVYLPTVLISLDGEVGKGSARSISGFDLYQALRDCKDKLIAFGGHKYAAGLTIDKKEIDRFRGAFQEVTQVKLSPEDRAPKLYIDDEITFSQIDDRMIRLLKYLAPFGPQNMRPVLASKGLEVVGSPAIVGNNHIKFKARQDRKVLSCVGFNMGDLFYRLAPGEPNLDLAYVIEENEWRGRKNIQLRVKALR